MRLLSKEDIKKVFTMKDAVEADKEAFMLFSQGKSVVPLRTNIPAPKHEGAFLFMPSYVEEMDCSAVKIVSVFPDNRDKGLPTTPAQVLLLDGTTGVVISVLDGTYITQLRTGAASGAAYDVLAVKNAKKGALIGTGGQAETQLEAMLTVRDLKEVKVYDISDERTKEFAENMSRKFSSYGTKITAAASSDEAIEDADMVTAVTPSLTPVFDGNKIKKGAVVSCVGSYQPHMQEMDPVILKRADKIYFDSKEAVLSEAGDILIPLADKTITEDDFTGDLGDVLLGKVPARENDEEIIVFKTVGIGTQDLVTAKRIYDKAKAQEIGLNWN